jgi:transposase
MRAVAALVAGQDREDVAAVFQVSLKAVDKWWAKWLAGGRGALAAQPRGRRADEHQLLSEVEQQAVRQAVLDHRPCDVGLAGQLWTRAGVGNLIAKLYRVRLTEQGVGKYLRRWGLTFQRPDKRAVEQNAEAVRVWHQETSNVDAASQRNTPPTHNRHRPTASGGHRSPASSGRGPGRRKNFLPIRPGPLGVAIHRRAGGPRRRHQG